MDEPLESRVGQILLKRRMNLALAESCTGGLVSNRITDVPGSSGYFLGGVVAYSNEAKMSLLGVLKKTLDQFGAISPETVLEMVRGVRDAFDADIAASISGIAGPGGGTSFKPVGTVWLGLVAPEGEWTRLHNFSGSREQIKAASADAALRLIVDYLEGKL